MTPESHRHICELFHSACEVKPQDRAAFLDRVCTHDAPVRAEVEGMLAADFEHASFLERRRPLGDGGTTCALFPGVIGVDEVSQFLRAHLERCAKCRQRLADNRVNQELFGQFRSHFPDYEPLRLCGEGAFGCVWIVRNRAGIYRAMKVIEQECLIELGLPHRELKALEAFCGKVPDHPNLVQIFHIGQHENMLYYTMELADDLITRTHVRDSLPPDYQPMTLKGRLLRGRLKVDTAVEITLRLLKGIECLHKARLVHRDIKPDNVIFVNREVKLGDITLLSTCRSSLSVAGTPAYLPPDQRMDLTADTYATGKMLHEMISGGDLSRFPRLPKDERIRSGRLDVQKLEELLIRACATSGDDRFGTAHEMRMALHACRVPSPDLPLAELADQQIRPSLDDSAFALVDSQGPRPIQDLKGEWLGKGQADIHVIGRTSRVEERLVWAVTDRIIAALPWLVLLALGSHLINRVTD